MQHCDPQVFVVGVVPRQGALATKITKPFGHEGTKITKITEINEGSGPFGWPPEAAACFAGRQPNGLRVPS